MPLTTAKTGIEAHDFYPVVEENVARAEESVTELEYSKFTLARAGVAVHPTTGEKLPRSIAEAQDRITETLGERFTDIFLRGIVKAYSAPTDTRGPSGGLG